MAPFGEYRTRRLVLEAWDRLGMEPRNRDGRYEVEANGVTLVPGGPRQTPFLLGKGPGQLAEATAERARQDHLPDLSPAIQRSFDDLTNGCAEAPAKIVDD